MATKKAPAKRRNRKNEKQAYIPGTEPPRIAAIDKLALQYKGIRDQRQELNLEEIKLKERLDKLMHEHNLKYYPVPDSDQEVVLEPGEEEVKVRKRRKAADDAAEPTKGE